MDPSSACGFFDIILGLFLEAKVDTGKLIGMSRPVSRPCSVLTRDLLIC